MINVPYLYIEYRERTSAYIGQVPLASVDFESNYLNSTTGFWRGASITFWIVIAIFVVIMIILIKVMVERPVLESDANAMCTYYFVRTIINAIDVFSTLFFWYLFAMTGYWFVFFKFQERVYCFLPGLDTWLQNYRPYDILFGLVASTKLVSVLFKISFEQCSMDIFLIDWERPKKEEFAKVD